MTTIEDSGELSRERIPAHTPAEEEPLTPEVLPNPLSGDPLLLALPTFCVGAIGLGLNLWGYIPAGSMLVLMGIVAALGVGFSAAWAAALGQSAVAGILGTFAGFWLSFPVLVMGELHGWWGITPAAAKATSVTFLVSFLVLFLAITLTTLRLFLAFTILMVVVDITVVLVLVSTLQASTGLSKAGAVGVWAFTAIGLYIWASQMSVGTGGKPYPLGRPILV